MPSGLGVLQSASTSQARSTSGFVAEDDSALTFESSGMKSAWSMEQFCMAQGEEGDELPGGRRGGPATLPWQILGPAAKAFNPKESRAPDLLQKSPVQRCEDLPCISLWHCVEQHDVARRLFAILRATALARCLRSC